MNYSGKYYFYYVNVIKKIVDGVNISIIICLCCKKLYILKVKLVDMALNKYIFLKTLINWSFYVKLVIALIIQYNLTYI